MAFDPFGSAIGTLASAFRGPGRTVPSLVGQPQNLLGGMGLVGPASVGLGGFGLGLTHARASPAGTTPWWGPGGSSAPWWMPQPVLPATTGPTTPGTTGAMASPGGDWANVDKLNDLIARAASEAGVDPNRIKAIMKLESDGVWQTSSAGAIGYMQVMPDWGDTFGLDLNDPYQNILAGAKVLKQNLDEHGGDFREALRAYHGYGDDGYTNDQQYADIVLGNYNRLVSGLGGQSGSTIAGGYGGSTGAMGGGGLGNIWGGDAGKYPITQEMGMTDFAAGNPLYDYAQAYHGFQGHPGLDIGTPAGTPLYTPVAGTVEDAGGTGYYCSYGSCGPGVGEFRIRLDNGDELILGHMSRITVQVGQRLQAGAAIGASGGENGDHVHVEYRQADGQGGFYIADPRQKLGAAGVATTGAAGMPTAGGGGTGGFPNWWSQWYATGKAY